jgi:DNA-binding transcriptional regulator YhcF (GntR family)
MPASAMDIVINRKSDVPIRDQLRFQLELQMLMGDLPPGARLPSVRALARRIHLHPNTVSTAYRDLEATRHVELRRGSGIFVRAAPTPPTRGATLDDLVHFALDQACRRGFKRAEIRNAVERWLTAGPPGRILVVDRSPEMAELLAREVSESLGQPASSCSLAQIASGEGGGEALVLTLPYHLEEVARLAPGALVESLTLEASEEARGAIQKLPPGSVVLLISHSPTVLPFADVFLRSLRGDEILVETRSLASPAEWLRLLPAADLVLVDACSEPLVRRARPRRRVQRIRVVSRAALERLRAIVSTLPDAIPAREASRGRRRKAARSG